MALRTYDYDTALLLRDEADILAYLDAVLAENDPALLAAALGDIARAKGMTKISKETGLGRESLYKALSDTGNPSFSTIQKVLASFGFRLKVVPV
ncbi:MAG: putative addiction module antidote protein [Clostridiales Family XIII bacterium]|jgi:probable addiction module antidote protein|nr:putative addiction module antidote protein [Clostridiales Family XIII bacterium]